MSSIPAARNFSPLISFVFLLFSLPSVDELHLFLVLNASFSSSNVLSAVIVCCPQRPMAVFSFLLSRLALFMVLLLPSWIFVVFILRGF